MDLLTYYLIAAGFGLIQCLSVTARSMFVNKAASIISFGGIVIVAILGLVYFEILDMLGGILTLFLVGMILSYIILKIKKRNAPEWSPEEENETKPNRIGENKRRKKAKRK